MVVIKIIYSNEEYEEGNDVILQYDTNNDYFDLETVKQMQKQIEELSDNILELTVQKEILDLKNRLHDQMNMGVSAIKQLIKQDDISFDDEAIIQLKRAISILKKEIEYPQDDLAQFIKDASVSKVDVIMTGEMIEDERYKSLLINLFRESCVNGANHGDASKLNIDIANDEKDYIITGDIVQ